MAKRCDICKRGPTTTFALSHAHNRSKKKVFLNLKRVKALVNGNSKFIRVCTKCISAGKVVKTA